MKKLILILAMCLAGSAYAADGYSSDSSSSSIGSCDSDCASDCSGPGHVTLSPAFQAQQQQLYWQVYCQTQAVLAAQQQQVLLAQALQAPSAPADGEGYANSPATSPLGSLPDSSDAG